MKTRLNPHSDGGCVLDTELNNVEFGPGDHSFLSWSFDPAVAQGSSTATGGVLQLVKLKLPAAALISNVALFVGTAGATLTANQCFASLYSASGALLSSTAQQATNWTTTGLKVMPLSAAQQMNSGYCYVGFYSVGTTQPAFLRGISGASGSNNMNLASPNMRYATANTGLTTAPPNPFTTQSSNNVAYWAAVS